MGTPDGGEWISAADATPTRPDSRVPRIPLVLLGSTASCVSSGPLSLKRGKLVEQAIPLADKTGLGPVTDILF